MYKNDRRGGGPKIVLKDRPKNDVCCEFYKTIKWRICAL